MRTAQSYLENLQGLLLFMYTQRGTLTSLAQLNQLDPSVRVQLESDFKEKFDEVVLEAKKREQETIGSLRKLVEFDRELQAPFTVKNKHIDDDWEHSLLTRKKPTVFQDAITYEIILQLAEKIFRVASKLQFIIPNEIVFGTLHTERFNACAIYLTDVNEHLIIFESQLFFFLNRISKIIAQCIVLKNQTEEDWQFSIKPEEMIEQIRANPLIQENFNRLMIAFIFENNVKATPNIVIPLPAQKIQSILLQSMELFIMAHEYTHVVKHHHRSNRHQFLQMNNISAEEVVPNWEKEFEADSFGVLLAAGAMNEEGFQEDFCLVGPDLFFNLSEIIEKAFAIKHGEIVDNRKLKSHPPASERRLNVRDALSKIFDTDQMEKASYLPEALNFALEYLWQRCIPFMENISQN